VEIFERRGNTGELRLRASISAASSIDWNASAVLVEGVKIIEKWTFRFIASQPALTSEWS
jgi:hypothetical protein